MTKPTSASASSASTSTVTTPTVTVGSPARLADDTAQGKTTISAAVVQKIAGIAAREIAGVYAMGGGVSRAFGAFRERIPGGGTGVSNIAGVQVEVGEKQAAVDLDIIVEYGASIVDLARAVRRNVITAVERMTGLEVIEVNIAVNDIQIPGAEDATDAPVAPPHMPDTSRRRLRTTPGIGRSSRSTTPSSTGSPASPRRTPTSRRPGR